MRWNKKREEEEEEKGFTSHYWQLTSEENTKAKGSHLDKWSVNYLMRFIWIHKLPLDTRANLNQWLVWWVERNKCYPVHKVWNKLSMVSLQVFRSCYNCWTKIHCLPLKKRVNGREVSKLVEVRWSGFTLDCIDIYHSQPMAHAVLAVWMGKLDTVINLFKWHMAESISWQVSWLQLVEW